MGHTKRPDTIHLITSKTYDSHHTILLAWSYVIAQIKKNPNIKFSKFHSTSYEQLEHRLENSRYDLEFVPYIPLKVIIIQTTTKVKFHTYDIISYEDDLQDRFESTRVARKFEQCYFHPPPLVKQRSIRKKQN